MNGRCEKCGDFAAKPYRLATCCSVDLCSACCRDAESELASTSVAFKILELHVRKFDAENHSSREGGHLQEMLDIVGELHAAEAEMLAIVKKWLSVKTQREG